MWSALLQFSRWPHEFRGQRGLHHHGLPWRRLPASSSSSSLTPLVPSLLFFCWSFQRDVYNSWQGLPELIQANTSDGGFNWELESVYSPWLLRWQRSWWMAFCFLAPTYDKGWFFIIGNPFLVSNPQPTSWSWLDVWTHQGFGRWLDLNLRAAPQKCCSWLSLTLDWSWSWFGL